MRKKLLGVIREEILLIAEKYGDERRTSIGFDEYDISMEDLIPVTNTVITMMKLGYIKRMSLDNFRAQNRGGKGIKGMETIDDDYIEELLMTTSHHYLMFFTNTGRVYRMKAYEIPEASRTRAVPQSSTCFSCSRARRLLRSFRSGSTPRDISFSWRQRKVS